MSDAEMLKAAVQCADALGCTGCPLEESGRCANYFANYIRIIKSEPAQAATCTDSEAVIGNDNTNSLCLNDTTKKAESQALSGISGLSCMESALNEWLGLGQEAEIVSVRADQTDSELVFEHKGEKYIMAFGRYEE